MLGETPPQYEPNEYPVLAANGPHHQPNPTLLQFCYPPGSDPWLAAGAEASYRPSWELIEQKQLIIEVG